MATRCYFGTEAPTVTPTFTGTWTSTSGAVRRMLQQAKFDSHVKESLTKAGATTGARTDYLIAQYTSQTLDVNQTITGTVNGQIRASISNASGKGVTQVFIWVMKTDGTSRGTLLAFNATDASEITTTLTNRKAPQGGAITLSSVAALATDRIVIEIGWSKFENAATSRTVQLDLGNPTGTDFPVDETTTTSSDVPWIEFSQNITFTPTNARSSSEVVEVVRSTTTNALTSSVVAEVVKGGTGRTGIVTSVVVEIVKQNVSGTGGLPVRSHVIIVG